MLDFIGGLIGTGAKLLGGIFGQNSQEKIAQENIQNQDFLARNRIQMTVADAKEAGINPLAALGNATQTYSNVAGSTALGDSIGDAGQQLGRSVAALAPVKLRNAELENKLLEAKIRNFDADTVDRMKSASDQATRLGQPGTGPGVPLPTADPRGPVINLVQRAFDPRTHEYVWIPSEKAASPLQTLAATPLNAALAGRELSEGLGGLGAPSDHGFSEVTGAVRRATSSSQYEPFLNSPAPY